MSGGQVLDAYLLIIPGRHVDIMLTDYQPVSYIIDNKRGTREQYRKMVDTCHRAGVNVMAGEFQTYVRESSMH
jgi:hypothetical protein